MPSASVALSLAADAVDAYPHPDLAPPSTWPGVLVIIIVIGFFMTAMVLGPIVRAIMQEELPEEGEGEMEGRRDGETERSRDGEGENVR